MLSFILHPKSHVVMLHACPKISSHVTDIHACWSVKGHVVIFSNKLLPIADWLPRCNNAVSVYQSRDRQCPMIG